MLIFLAVVAFVLFILWCLGFRLGLRSVVNDFKIGNCSVSGMKGSGKDVLFSNVVARRHLPYICNVDYHCKGSEFIPLDLKQFDTKNSFKDFINNTLKYYNYPYKDKIDIYISDAGIYFPAQYCSTLDREFGYLPQFMADSRHLGDCAVHYNSQNLNRVWDKIREQSDIYYLCKGCKFFGKLVFERVFIYEKYQSCIDRVKPFKPLKAPIFANSEARALIRTHNDQSKNKYENDYGFVKKRTFIFFNRSKFDSRFIKSMLLQGKKENENNK